MRKTAVTEFERITKYPLLDYMDRIGTFFGENYQYIDDYYSGTVESVDAIYINEMNSLSTETERVLTLFRSFREQLDNCMFWELMDYIQDVCTNICKTQQLYFYRRTLKSNFGYKNYITIDREIGGLKTVDDLAESSNTDWTEIMRENDLNETDWEIDRLKNVRVTVERNSLLSVSTILGEPTSSNLYGKDLTRFITIENNDLKVVSNMDNLIQKCDILLCLDRGDVPENYLFGKNKNLYGSTVRSYFYSELISDVRNNFLQNDLFRDITVQDIKYDNGSILATISITTRYNNVITKQITI